MYNTTSIIIDFNDKSSSSKIKEKSKNDDRYYIEVSIINMPSENKKINLFNKLSEDIKKLYDELEEIID